jgi:putative pyruvate formate lyase activating enzyme
MGREVSAAEFAEICLALQKHGAENINIDTGSHAVDGLLDGMRLARAGGLALPFLWNSSAYERPETLELLRGLADMFLPDLKTLDAGIASAFLNAGDYPERAERAIFKMMEMAGSKDAVIIRHLMLPGFAAATRDVLRWFADNAAGRATLSLMTQYTPVTPPVGTGAEADTGTLKAPRRFVSEAEYEAALSWLEEFGIEDGFYQELEHDGDWLPDFSRTNPFPSGLSVPVWHWKQPRD